MDQYWIRATETTSSPHMPHIKRYALDSGVTQQVVQRERHQFLNIIIIYFIFGREQAFLEVEALAGLGELRRKARKCSIHLSSTP